MVENVSRKSNSFKNFRSSFVQGAGIWANFVGFLRVAIIILAGKHWHIQEVGVQKWDINAKLRLPIILAIILLLAGFSVGTAGALSGGPDFMGYTFKDSNEPGGPIFNWIEINATGTRNETLNNSDDHFIDGIPVGFFFNFYGTDYSQLSITNNGIILASGGSGQYTNQPIGSSSIDNFIAPFWDDIVTWNNSGSPLGQIYYQTIGAAPNRKFVVEWQNNQHYSSSPKGITFEAILFEGSNNILFQYQDVNFGQPGNDNGGSATVGIESSTGQGLQYSFDQSVLSPGLAILFKFPQFNGTNLVLTKQAPTGKDHGSTMIYNLFYHNFGNIEAKNVTLNDTLPPEVEFVSASDNGSFDPITRNVTWNISNVSPFPSGHGYQNITVRIPDGVATGTVIQNTAYINTSNLEVRYDDNIAYASTRVTGTSLPPNVSVGPTNGNSGGTGTPSVYYGNPVTFSYHSCPGATGVNINIHIDDGGQDINGSMTGGPPDWNFTVTFYPRHGHATITYTVTGCAQAIVGFDIYIDPAGYIYDISTGARIQGATVWLQRMNASNATWENVPTGQVPNISQPDVNPLITGVDGQYQWDVLPGSYRVHVEASGYYPADSIAVSIPPPVTDLNVGLTQITNNISSCTTINSSGFYVLNQSIPNSGTSTCINITASNVTFDGAGYTIDGVSTVNSYGVYVYNSTAALTNVKVKNLKVTDWYYGILYQNVQNGSITNNSASSNSDGIVVGLSSSNTVSDNIVRSGTGYGINIAFSNNNTLTNNSLSLNGGAGIRLANSNNNTLTNNNASSNSGALGAGIFLEVSNNYNIISNNTANSNGGFGLLLQSSSNYNTLNSNNANSNGAYGIALWSSGSTNVTNNTANSNNNYGIFLDSSGNNTLGGNNASSNNYGIWLTFSSNYNTISNNTVRNNTNTGINLESSNNNNLTSNNISYNNQGGSPWNFAGLFLQSSNNNTFTNNRVSNNPFYGVRLQSSTGNNFTDNDIVYNCGGEAGIVLFSSSSNIFKNNNISSNTGDGIQVWAPSENNNFIKNIISSNNNPGKYGMLIWGSNNNSIYNNYFNNTNNASDNGANFWNTTLTSGVNIVGGPNLGGNFWASPDGNGFSQTCTDGNKDGICDLNYSIPGGSNTDSLPLALPPPIIVVIPPGGGGGPSTGGPSTGGGGVVFPAEPKANLIAYQTIERSLLAGQPITFSFSEPELWVYEIVVTGNQNEDSVAIRGEALVGQSSQVNVPAPGTRYINFWAGTKRIKEALIRFKVPISWIASEGIASSSDVRMYRWDGSNWIQLDTAKKTEDATYAYYEAKTDTFSYFAISGLKTVPTATSTVIATVSPGTTTAGATQTGTPSAKPPATLNWILYMIVAIVIIVAVYFFAIRKK